MCGHSGMMILRIRTIIPVTSRGEVIVIQPWFHGVLNMNRGWDFSMSYTHTHIYIYTCEIYPNISYIPIDIVYGIIDVGGTGEGTSIPFIFRFFYLYAISPSL